MLQSLILTVAGMGTVFLFLILMVYMMTLNARLIRVLEEKGIVNPAEQPGATACHPKDDMARVAAAIAVARRALCKA